MKMIIYDNTAPSEKKTYINEAGFDVYQEVTEWPMGRGPLLYPLSFRGGLVDMTVLLNSEERQQLINLLQNAWAP